MVTNITDQVTEQGQLPDRVTNITYQLTEQGQLPDRGYKYYRPGNRPGAATRQGLQILPTR